MATKERYFEKKIEESHATGKSQRLFSVDPDTIAFMRA